MLLCPDICRFLQTLRNLFKDDNVHKSKALNVYCYEVIPYWCVKCQICKFLSLYPKIRPQGKYKVKKNPPANAGDSGSIPGKGRSPREGNGNPLQYPCLENPMDRGAWQATVVGVTRVRRNLATKQQKYTS